MLGDEDQSSDVMLSRDDNWVFRSRGQLTPPKSPADVEDPVGIGSGCQLKKWAGPWQRLMASEGGQFFREAFLLYLQQDEGFSRDKLVCLERSPLEPLRVVRVLSSCEVTCEPADFRNSNGV